MSSASPMTSDSLRSAADAEARINAIATRLMVDPCELIAAIMETGGGTLSVSSLVHGTLARYNTGCRCEACVEYRNSTRRARVAKLSEASVPEQVSHGSYAYSQYGCRCEECTTAHYESVQIQKRERQNVTLKSASRKGQQWTGPELEIAAREDLSIREAALMLGRTYYAVMNMRTKLRRGDPKATFLAGVPRQAGA